MDIWEFGLSEKWNKKKKTKIGFSRECMAHTTIREIHLQSYEYKYEYEWDYTQWTCVVVSDIRHLSKVTYNVYGMSV